THLAESISVTMSVPDASGRATRATRSTHWVDAISDANGDCQRPGSAVVAFMCEVGIGFTPSALGYVFEREIREGCANLRRGKPAKLQKLARLLLAEPDHRGVAAVLGSVAALAENDSDVSNVKLDCNKEFWAAHAA